MGARLSGRRPGAAVASVALAACSAIAAAIAAGPPAAGSQAAPPAQDRAPAACRASFVPVAQPLTTAATTLDARNTLGVAAAPAHRMFARTCVPSSGPVPDTVQVLVHGATYDHRYWNIRHPGRPADDRYSWEAAAARAGYATVALDRLGNGRSSRPHSTALTPDANAAALHELVRALRAGEVRTSAGRVAFANVVLVGHSYGSAVSIVAAARYGDVDGLVLTGHSHAVRGAAALTPIGGFHRARADPAFRAKDLDDGYLTTIPGRRRSIFYSPGTDVERAIVARDEATKGTVSRSEFAAVLAVPSVSVRVPVLIIDGALDGIFCAQAPNDSGAPCATAAALAAHERPRFLAAPSVQAAVIPGVGHALNGFRNAGQAFDIAMRWTDEQFGSTLRQGVGVGSNVGSAVGSGLASS